MIHSTSFQDQEPAGEGHSWERHLFRYKGWNMKVQIADQSGSHHSPVRYYTLEQIKPTADGELRFYFNELQFIAVPLFNAEDTRHMVTVNGGRFISIDRARELIYTIDFFQQS